MRVLVTGGAGYLGSILAEHLLAKGYAVTVLDNLMYQQRPLLHLCHNSNFEFVNGDARNTGLIKDLLRSADAIVPLAAIVGAPACDEDPRLAEEVNLEAIETILALRSKDQAILYPCTNSGYGSRTGDLYCDETTPMEPISHYGRTKATAEQRILNAGNAISLRLATVFGISPRMRLDLLVNTFVYEAVVRGYLILFESSFKRNYIHIRDVADAFLHGLAHWDAMRDEIYNVGLDSAILSKAELAERIQCLIPDLFVHYAEVGRDPDKRNYIVSSEKLKRAGFSAQRSLESGIRELMIGYRMLGRLDGQNPKLRMPALPQVEDAVVVEGR